MKYGIKHKHTKEYLYSDKTFTTLFSSARLFDTKLEAKKHIANWSDKNQMKIVEFKSKIV